MPTGHELARRLLVQRAVWSIFVVVLAPIFNRLPRLSKGEKPILIQALSSQSAIEAFNESIVFRLARSAELDLHAVTMCGQCLCISGIRCGEFCYWCNLDSRWGPDNSRRCNRHIGWTSGVDAHATHVGSSPHVRGHPKQGGYENSIGSCTDRIKQDAQMACWDY